MSPARLAIVTLTALAVAALFGWQLRRERIAKACLDSGGVWDGRVSACKPPVRPILRRELERS